MAKKSQRRPVRCERDQLGCMWGFISMFNFRHGRSAQKLLVDRRHGSRSSNAAVNLRNKLDKPAYSNENSQETLGGEERNVATEVGKPSVKKLIEEDLLTEQGTKREMIEGQVRQLSESELEGGRKKKKQRRNRNRNKSFDNFSHINAVDHAESEFHSNPKHHSVRSLDIDNMIEEFCCEIHQRNTSRVNHDQPNQRHEDYKEKLSELIKFLISQKLLHGNRPREDSEILTSKDLMEVFQILGSDEELFLKLLQDPDLLMSKDVQDLQNVQREKEEGNSSSVEGENLTSVGKSNLSKQSDPLVSRKQRSFFRRKTKPQERNRHNESETSDRIVILKPGPATLLSLGTENCHVSLPESHSMINKGQNERISSHFFLAEIKRKLKHAIGKEQRGVPGGGGIKDGFRKSIPTKEHFFIERMARPTLREKKGEKGVYQKDSETGTRYGSGNSKQRLSNIYIEAKKHLSEMLNDGDIDPNFTGEQIPRTLGRILSLPEYLSPLGSPGWKCEKTSLSAHKRSASEEFQHVDGNKKENHESLLGQIKQKSDARPCISDVESKTSVELPLLSFSRSPDDENDNEVDEPSGIDEITSASNVETVRSIEITTQEENTPLDASSEPCSSSVIKDYHNDDDVSEVCNDETDNKIMKQDSLEERQPSSPVESPSYSLTKSEEFQVGGSDLPEWSSPVSVLEPLFTEDDISPARIRFPSVETQVQPLCIQFEEKDPLAEIQGKHMKTSTDDKESVFEYVKAVLSTSNFNWEELYMKSLSSDQLLVPSLINNVQFFPNQLCSDHELLLDCINEVLLDFCGHQFGCSPWVSFIKPKTQRTSNMKNTIHKVQDGVYLHLLPLPLPHSLDQIVRKDMAKDGNWLDLRFDVDCIVTETSEVILEELTEEMIFQLN